MAIAISGRCCVRAEIEGGVEVTEIEIIEIEIMERSRWRAARLGLAQIVRRAILRVRHGVNMTPNACSIDQPIIGQLKVVGIYQPLNNFNTMSGDEHLGFVTLNQMVAPCVR